jgi:hypothetical protein
MICKKEIEKVFLCYDNDKCGDEMRMLGMWMAWEKFLLETNPRFGSENQRECWEFFWDLHWETVGINGRCGGRKLEEMRRIF